MYVRVAQAKGREMAGTVAAARSLARTGDTMELDDLILVSVDDHVVEPGHIFEGRMPAKFQDLAPGW